MTGSSACTRMSGCRRGWDVQLAQQLEEAEQRFGPIGVAGVYGVSDVIAADCPGQPSGAQRIGYVVDRGRLLNDGPDLPARVTTLEELALVVRRDTPLQFDPALGKTRHASEDKTEDKARIAKGKRKGRARRRQEEDKTRIANGKTRGRQDTHRERRTTRGQQNTHRKRQQASGGSNRE